MIYIISCISYAGYHPPSRVTQQIAARLGQLIAPLEGSPHVEELFSEHLAQARDLYQKYAAFYADQLTATIERVCRKRHLALSNGMTSRDFARCIEMAFNGTKSAYPAMQPADAFLRDLEIMVRTLVAGAVSSSPRKPSAKPAPAKKSTRRKTGDRR